MKVVVRPNFDTLYFVCKKLYAKAGNYEGNGCYIQVD